VRRPGPDGGLVGNRGRPDRVVGEAFRARGLGFPRGLPRGGGQRALGAAEPSSIGSALPFVAVVTVATGTGGFGFWLGFGAGAQLGFKDVDGIFHSGGPLWTLRPGGGRGPQRGSWRGDIRGLWWRWWWWRGYLAGDLHDLCSFRSARWCAPLVQATGIHLFSICNRSLADVFTHAYSFYLYSHTYAFH